MTVWRWWWSHYETGSPHKHFAWCNVCDSMICSWPGPNRSPATIRKIQEHGCNPFRQPIE